MTGYPSPRRACAPRAASWRSASTISPWATAEAPALLLGAGVELGDEDVRELVRHTEGWPVGLYLAALAMTSGSPHTGTGLTFTGDDRFMGDYLRSEILDRVSPTEASFLTRTSILEAMSGPLCDATLGATGSSRALEELENRNLLVLPVDHRREWYRYHHLFRELLSTELRRREPELVPELHLRAAAWFEANGMPETAIDHAQAAGDADRVARVTIEGRQPCVGEWQGRHRVGLDEVVRRPGPGGALPGDRSARRADVRVDGPAGGDRTLGGGGRTRAIRRDTRRREHGGGHRCVPAGAPGA